MQVSWYRISDNHSLDHDTGKSKVMVFERREEEVIEFNIAYSRGTQLLCVKVQTHSFQHSKGPDESFNKKCCNKKEIRMHITIYFKLYEIFCSGNVQQKL